MPQGPYSTNLLIAGWDEKTGPSLFWMDYLATMHSMNIAGTGYGEHLLDHCHISSTLTGLCHTHKGWNSMSPRMVRVQDPRKEPKLDSAHTYSREQSIMSADPSKQGMCAAGSYFVLSMLDRLWHPDLTQEEALKLMEKGIEEVSFLFRLLR